MSKLLFNLDDDLINENVVAKMKSGSNKYFFRWSDIKFTHLSLDCIKTQSSTVGRADQTFTYNRSIRVLVCECNCSQKSTSCEHITEGLELILSRLSSRIFTPTYVSEFKEKVFRLYGLPPDQDYTELFAFHLTKDGLQYETKVKNLQKANAPLPTSEEMTIESILLGAESKEESNEGLAYLFTYEYQSLALRPFTAKLNKQGTDMSSNFKEVFNDIPQMLHMVPDKDLFFDILSLRSLWYKSNKDVKAYLIKACKLAETICLNKSFTYLHEGNTNIIRKNLIPLTWAQDVDVRLYFTFAQNGLVYTFKAHLYLGTDECDLGDQMIVGLGFVIKDRVVYPIKDVDTAFYIHKYAKQAELNYLGTDYRRFQKEVVIPLSAQFEVRSDLFNVVETKTADAELEKQVYLTDYDGQFIVFKLAVKYPSKLVPIESNELIYDAENDIYVQRNQSFEDNFKMEFTELHPAFDQQSRLFYLNAEQVIDDFWLIKATEKMKGLGITVMGANNLKSFRFNVNKPIINVGVRSDLDWFDLNIEIKFGDQKVGLKELQRAFIKKSNYVSLSDGTLGILPEEWMKKFANFFKVGEVKKNGVQLSNYQFGVIDELFNELETKPPFLVELMEKKRRLQNISEIQAIDIPQGIQATLRDYQHHGFNWLVFLDKNKLGGCLADDMGLGKTLQAITFLQYMKERDGDKPQTSLIIAPTSLMFNWRNELDKFCPSLKVLLFVGPNRMEKKDELLEYDIVLSTYGSLLNDIEMLSKIRFNYIILDESQAIKNPNSKRYKSVRLLNAHNRLTLTGTPIENNTFDLYAQMNFLNPGLLGNMAHFKKEFSDSIDKEKNVDSAQLLSQMIGPFLLRRTKEQVATELPEKTESVIYCDMGTEQRKVYDAFKHKYRDYLLNKIDENGAAKSQMYILEGLTKLRQICNSTSLLPEDQDYGHYSIKLDTLMEAIKEKTGQHKILVFSQFVQMLQLIKTRLEDEHITYEYLDGQSTDREGKVNNFQENKSVRVFLISLKAGGVGLNLTEADYVFLVDPWWNPAVENQAIDRCYRIGQKRQVMAYRMICKDTIEDKIVSLQSKKKAVASSIIQIDDEQKSFDVEQVRELFS